VNSSELQLIDIGDSIQKKKSLKSSHYYLHLHHTVLITTAEMQDNKQHVSSEQDTISSAANMHVKYQSVLNSTSSHMDQQQVKENIWQKSHRRSMLPMSLSSKI